MLQIATVLIVRQGTGKLDRDALRARARARVSHQRPTMSSGCNFLLLACKLAFLCAVEKMRALARTRVSLPNTWPLTLVRPSSAAIASIDPDAAERGATGRTWPVKWIMDTGILSRRRQLAKIPFSRSATNTCARVTLFLARGSR